MARSSNEAEIQSMTVGEDAAFTLRLLWGEINGAGVKTGFPLSRRAQYVVDMVKSVTATDSKGVFDAINNNESSDLGLRNSRSAIEAAALKKNYATRRTCWCGSLVIGTWRTG